MKSKKFSLYYLLTALSTILLVFLATFLFTDLPKGNKLGENSEAMQIPTNPLYLIWIALSFIFYIISRFIQNERKIFIFNKVVVFAPLLLIVIFYFINVFSR